VIRSDPSVRLPEKAAERVIYEIVPQEAEVTNVSFDPKAPIHYRCEEKNQDFKTNINPDAFDETNYLLLVFREGNAKVYQVIDSNS